MQDPYVDPPEAAPQGRCQIGSHMAPDSVRYQSQAVLRRATSSDPLLLVGVTVDGTFYPKTARDARGRFVLSKGLVALAPLSHVDAATAAAAAAVAIIDATDHWDGKHSPGAPRTKP